MGVNHCHGGTCLGKKSLKTGIYRGCLFTLGCWVKGYKLVIVPPQMLLKEKGTVECTFAGWSVCVRTAELIEE